jgi:hypothetical protein
LGVTLQVSVDAFTMERDIKALALFFLGHAQANDDIGDF